MRVSEITLGEVWDRIWLSKCPFIRILWENNEIWNDDADIECWLNPEEAIKKWAEEYPTWRNFIVDSIEFDVVDYHHFEINIYGEWVME